MTAEGAAVASRVLLSHAHGVQGVCCMTAEGAAVASRVLLSHAHGVQGVLVLANTV